MAPKVPSDKELAAELAKTVREMYAAGKLSEVTVKIHRGSAMRKMGARTLADLVRMADTLSLRQPA